MHRMPMSPRSNTIYLPTTSSVRRRKLRRMKNLQKLCESRCCSSSGRSTLSPGLVLLEPVPGREQQVWFLALSRTPGPRKPPPRPLYLVHVYLMSWPASARGWRRYSLGRRTLQGWMAWSILDRRMPSTPSRRPSQGAVSASTSCTLPQCDSYAATALYFLLQRPIRRSLPSVLFAFAYL